MSWKNATWGDAIKYVDHELEYYSDWCDPNSEDYESDDDQRRYYEHKRDVLEFIKRELEK